MLRSLWIRVPAVILLGGLSLWSCLAVLYAGGSGQPGPARIALAAAWVAALSGCVWMRGLGAPTWIVALVGNVLVLAWWASLSPSKQRVWTSEQARAPRVEIAGERVRLHDLRDFTVGEDGDAVVEQWYDAEFDLDRLVRAYYVVVPFSKDAKALAHTMISLEFEQGRFLAVSVETRRERGEPYSPLRGLFRQYEVIYVMGSERDLIGRRIRRGDPLYLYPMRASREATRDFALDVLRRAEKLAREPEFYNTLTSTCTTNLVRHLEHASGRQLPCDLRIALPGYSDQLAFELGLIDSELEFEAAREQFRVDERMRGVALDGDYSGELHP